MAQITAALVKELRERTGSGMMECKKALQETNGDIDAAVEDLRKTGMAKAEKKAAKRKELKAQFEGDERPDADARYEHQLQMLNDKMAYQKEVEKILNKDQYDTWKEHQNTRNRGQAGRKGHGKRNSNKRES